MKEEKIFKPYNGYGMLALAILLVLVPIPFLVIFKLFILILLMGIGVFMMMGVFIVNPNESMVITLFGAYKGTVIENGFFWANPFFTKRKISLRARNIDSEPIKVNDKVGNPIMIGIVLVWRVKDTFKAAFDVDDYVKFVEIQSEAAIRKLAGDYPYDNLKMRMQI